MMREKLLKLAKDLGVGIIYTSELPESYWGAFDSMNEVVELNIGLLHKDYESYINYILLHELCHALQYCTHAPIWLRWAEEIDEGSTSCSGLLELDCEQRAIGWLYQNGYDVEAYVPMAQSNLLNYGLKL